MCTPKPLDTTHTLHRVNIDNIDVMSKTYGRGIYDTQKGGVHLVLCLLFGFKKPLSLLGMLQAGGQAVRWVTLLLWVDMSASCVALKYKDRVKAMLDLLVVFRNGRRIRTGMQRARITSGARLIHDVL